MRPKPSTASNIVRTRAIWQLLSYVIRCNRDKDRMQLKLSIVYRTPGAKRSRGRDRLESADWLHEHFPQCRKVDQWLCTPKFATLKGDLTG